MLRVASRRAIGLFTPIIFRLLLGEWSKRHSSPRLLILLFFLFVEDGSAKLVTSVDRGQPWSNCGIRLSELRPYVVSRSDQPGINECMPRPFWNSITPAGGDGDNDEMHEWPEMHLVAGGRQ
jgi:hypothetical protein